MYIFWVSFHRFDGKFNSAITRIYPINKEYFLVACKDGHVLLVRKYEDTLCGQSWLEQPSDSSSHVVSISHYFIKTELYVVILFGSGNLKHYEIIIDPKEECIFDTEESSFCPFSVPRKSVFIGDSDIRQNTKNATIGDFYVLSDTQFISIAKNVIPSSIGVVWDHDKNLVVLSLFECDNMEIIYREKQLEDVRSLHILEVLLKNIDGRIILEIVTILFLKLTGLQRKTFFVIIDGKKMSGTEGTCLTLPMAPSNIVHLEFASRPKEEMAAMISKGGLLMLAFPLCLANKASQTSLSYVKGVATGKAAVSAIGWHPTCPNVLGVGLTDGKFGVLIVDMETFDSRAGGSHTYIDLSLRKTHHGAVIKISWIRSNSVDVMITCSPSCQSSMMISAWSEVFRTSLGMELPDHREFATSTENTKLMQQAIPKPINVKSEGEIFILGIPKYVEICKTLFNSPHSALRNSLLIFGPQYYKGSGKLSEVKRQMLDVVSEGTAGFFSSKSIKCSEILKNILGVKILQEENLRLVVGTSSSVYIADLDLKEECLKLLCDVMIQIELPQSPNLSSQTSDSEISKIMFCDSNPKHLLVALRMANSRVIVTALSKDASNAMHFHEKDFFTDELQAFNIQAMQLLQNESGFCVVFATQSELRSGRLESVL
eukprot:GHVP01002985.1.p1 GENE.GHVP01002985.1~~GHVP01002985.1.p1  ORF type:complete len:657 (-),score=97.29 GHVP01002985.1:62-2032(-)